MGDEKRTLTKIITVLLICLMTFSLAVPAFAATVKDVEDAYDNLSGEDKNSITYDENNNTLKISGSSVVAYDSKTKAQNELGSNVEVTTVKVGNTTYFMTNNSLDGLYRALTDLNNSSFQKRQDQSVQRAMQDVESISNSGVRADLGAAQKTLSGVSEVLGVILGILAYLIMMLLTVLTCLDIAYITIPPLRKLFDSIGQGGGGSGAMSSINKSTNEAKFRWITDEAMYAVQTATIESGKSAITVYLGRRIVAIIMVGIAVYLLLTGNIGLIMNFALKIVSGIIDQLSSLGQL